MSSPFRPRSPSEAELASLHLSFSACDTPAAFFRPDPTPSPAYLSDEDLAFEPLEPSVVESQEDEFAARAQLALLAMSTPPMTSTASIPPSTRGSPEVMHSPENRGARDGYFSRCLFASADASGPYGVPVSASTSGASTPALDNSLSPGPSRPSSAPTTPPDLGYSAQPITPLSLAALNKANMKARGMRLPPQPSARAPSASPSAAAPTTAEPPRTPTKTVKGFDLDLGLGILSSNFTGISLSTGRSAPLAKDLVEVERPSSPAFRTKPRRTQYAF